ncbi:PTS sugar transporter subunit IIB [Clostridium sp. Marseille-Q2269]|uniref:PTS sugar transporter subunit IIB n=1 Tax=Clostridium sp. Marseille-Q2269 TaxID=2942205 RepID=UPI002074770A|nr:PTS sugar transporter subunit IIB [Clostridium sp. Marseille-Q2269]
MNILLICSAGMSTSLLVTKMQKVAKDLNFESKIWAVSTDSADENMAHADVVLIGPQIKFMLESLKEKGKKLNVPVEVINSSDYGTCNGKNVLKQALSMKRA